MSPRPASAPAPDPQHHAASEQGASHAFSWPHDVSRDPSMSIGVATRKLKEEFPTISISKVRFLEDVGIVRPARTGAGYRKFSQADLERLRFALSVQRDTCQTWERIGCLLDDLDAGRIMRDLAPARMVARDGELVAPAGRPWLAQEELETLTGITSEELEELETAGLIKRDPTGVFPARSISITTKVVELRKLGLPTRNLKALAVASRRYGDLINAVLAPMRARNTGAAREQAAARATELAAQTSALFAEMLFHELES